MSDPAKTPEEIEDVLASIRRLVSDASPGKSAVAKQASTAASDDRLVLTPSFRVTDPEDPWIPVASTHDDAVGEAAGSSASTDDSDWQPDDRLARFDAVGDAEQPSDVSKEDIADLLHLDGTTAELADFESETGDDNWPGPGAEAALLTLVARREPVGLVDVAKMKSPSEKALSNPKGPEAEVSGEDFDPSEAEGAEKLAEADDAESDAEEKAFAQALADEAVEKVAASHGDRSEGDADLEAMVHEAVAAEETVFDEPSEEAEEESGLHNAAGDKPSDAYEDGPENASGEPHDETFDEAAADVDVSDDEPSPVPIFSARAARQEAEEQSVDDLEEDTSPFSFPDAEDSILDEETLREIIVDVVREELQGVLGQRITRNVRKMVRREVRLALAAEDLE